MGYPPLLLQVGGPRHPPHKHPFPKPPSSSVTEQAQNPGSRYLSQRYTNLHIPSAKKNMGLGFFSFYKQVG